MSEAAERALGRAQTPARPALDGRSWKPGRSESISRREVVNAVNEWVPYPVAPELVAVDLAVAALESGDESEALERLANAPVREALVAVLEDALGSGDLADWRAYRRSTTILGLHRQDLVALSRLASRLGPRLGRLLADLEENERLITRARSAGIQTLLSAEVAKGAASSLMGDERRVTRVESAPIDLAVVPPRVFAWEGPERNELRLIRTEGHRVMELRVEVGAPGANAGDYVAFVTVGKLAGEAPLVRTKTGSLRAAVDLGVAVNGHRRRPIHFGIRHSDVSTEWALSRLASGEAEVTRTLVETWTRVRLRHASLAVQWVGGLPSVRWTSPSVSRAANVTYEALKARREELLSWSKTLVAGGDPLERNRSATAAAGHLLEDAATWAVKPELEGARRPLICETLLVLHGTTAAAVRKSRRQ